VGRLIAGVLAASALAGGAAAQVQDTQLTLLCKGTDSVAAMGKRGGMGMGMGGMGMRESRVSALLGVLVQGEKIRVRPPASSLPMMPKKTEDGWYDLNKPQVTMVSIRGKTSLGPMNTARLDVDRRTGVVTFGRFNGVCRAVSNIADETVF
jgi:hypothetical protein